MHWHLEEAWIRRWHAHPIPDNANYRSLGAAGGRARLVFLVVQIPACLHGRVEHFVQGLSPFWSRAVVEQSSIDQREFIRWLFMFH